MSELFGVLNDRILRIVTNGRKRHYPSPEIARFIVDAMNEHETHVRRMMRLLAEQEISRKCNAYDLTFGNRCLNCGHTPEDHKVTLTSPRLDRKNP